MVLKQRKEVKTEEEKTIGGKGESASTLAKVLYLIVYRFFSSGAFLDCFFK